jgi:hypothetical protein
MRLGRMRHPGRHEFGIAIDSDITKFISMEKSVREPIQVYLTAAERDVLDQCAAELGVSRSEVLRQGLRAVGERRPGTATGPPTPPPALRQFLTPAAAGPGAPPPSRPVAPLEELLEELSRDRDAR